LASLKTDMPIVKTDIVTLKTDLAVIKAELAMVKWIVSGVGFGVLLLVLASGRADPIPNSAVGFPAPMVLSLKGLEKSLPGPPRTDQTSSR
jgi:hypothetical protein